MTTGEGSAPEGGRAAGRPGPLALGGAILIAAGVAIVVLVDLVLGAFVGIIGMTLLVSGALARDWERHSTYEDRERDRARKRKAKWERGSAARDRDRARWEAHHARQAKKSGR